MNSNEIRKKFLEYFHDRQHEIVPSSSLIPSNDPTLLFTNSGMVQFKYVFLGTDKRSYQRATSAQRCMRAGGKHNDLENVGYTKRHHTFFEMLGNFSFGAYFKEEAIKFGWEFLTEVLQLPREKLWVSVYENDQESEKIWLDQIGIDPKRISRCGQKDNFWQMGDTGPCGPCTEIFYDHGPEIWGGPPGSPEADGDRYVEIWNIVFMQYERDEEGKLSPLPKPCVDTGMGLERISAVMEGVHDNYDIALFQHLLRALSKLVSCQDFQNHSMRVIVDHIRSISFLIADGILPSNEGRGYVLRRIIRRAARHGNRLGQTTPFLYQLVPALIEVMGDAYPIIKNAEKQIQQALKQEEILFSNTLERGLKILDEETKKLATNVIPGSLVFLLYDTYGFPPDLTADIARERHLLVDQVEFENCMQLQRDRSREVQHFKMGDLQKIKVDGETQFLGYDILQTQSEVTALFKGHEPVSELNMGDTGIVVLNKTPFYAESGGQVGDSGLVSFSGGEFRVRDTQKQGQVFLHYGVVERGQLTCHMAVTTEVNSKRRHAIMLNHSATHLLHEALRRVLGNHVRQKGSLVEAERLRFDFSHPQALTTEEIREIERLVNHQIHLNLKSHLDTMSPEEAQQQGALALFGERYGNTIRVLTMGDFSKEICGGTHVEETGAIGLLKITHETACASGVRRIEAVTGETALAYIEQKELVLNQLTNLLKTSDSQLLQRVEQLLEKQQSLESELVKIKQKMNRQSSESWIQTAQTIQGVQVLATIVDETDVASLRTTLDQLQDKMKPAAIILGSVVNDRVQLLSAVSKDCFNAFNAVDLLQMVAQQIGGKGGGKPDRAMGGGIDVTALPKALESVYTWVKNKLG